MPSDDYAPVGGGGALKLKGAKVDKKKKKKAKKTDLEKNLDADSAALVPKEKDAATDEPKPEEEEEDKPQYQKTESELKYEEYKKKRVSAEEMIGLAMDMANEALQLLKMAESSASRPELLKTHKERVEELNTYLSKLSEHHDMPKIGPG